MPSEFEFIETAPSNTVDVSNRRRIRSQAARAGNGNHRAGIPGEFPQRARYRSRRPIVWPVVIGSVRQSGHDSEIHNVQGTGSMQEHIGHASIPTTELYRANYVLMPFSGNDGMLPISQSRLYPLPFLSLVLQHYIDNLTGPIPEIDGPNETNLLRKQWFPLVLHSKALFQILVLFAASHYAIRHEYSAHHASDLLYIKHYALRGLQAALQTGDFNKDENIAAVAKLAAYEAIFGSEASYHVHMDGLERMLDHRGGLSALGMNGLLARLLIFIDTNSACLLTTKLHLSGPGSARQEPGIPPNLARFMGPP